MNVVHFHLVVKVQHGQATVVVLENVSPGELVATIVREVLQRLGLPDEPGWCLELQGTALPSQAEIRLHLPATAAPIELVLRWLFPAASGIQFELTLDDESGSAVEDGKDLFEETNFDVPALEDGLSSKAAAIDESDTDLEGSDFELSLGDDSGTKAKITVEEEEPELDLEDLEASGPRKKPMAEEDEDEAEEAVSVRPGAKVKKAATRRATVRYYSRMNPERVYPLLVLITRGMVEKVQKKDTKQQSSGPFAVDVETPVEIEPILPGCDCHPPKVTARLGQGDLNLTFRVVPRVLGRVDGAIVSIRQDHASLAEIELDVRVVKQTWVILSGLATFLLPGLSAVMKHFGLDFATWKEHGFSLYLAAARLVFDRVTPLGLTALLGLGTVLLWWRTRPRARDVFWDIEKVGPGEKLKRIAVAMQTDPDKAGNDLLELLAAFPDYQPAKLFYADWHYTLENYQAAFKGYARAFKLGIAKASHYLKASLAASRLGLNEKALLILQIADKRLPADGMTGVMLYNMGCYHARLGDLDESMACLRRAVKANYRKRETYLKDPDLEPLRNRTDFKHLVANLGQR